jgi:hypothetical protein
MNEVVGGGVYLPPPPTSIAVGEAAGDGCTEQSGAPSDMHCSLTGGPPRHPTVRVRSWVDRWSFVFLRHRTVRCPSDFCRDTVYFVESTVGADSRCSAGSPDSPMAHRTVR